MSAPNAAVVAVQDGRIVGLGSSRKLGRYVILRDVYGDVFTYAGLGSIAPTIACPSASAAPVARRAPVAAERPRAAASGEAPAQLGELARQRRAASPCSVKRSHAQTTPSQDSIPAGSAESVPAATGKVRLFAHPGNPDALAAAARAPASAPATGLRPADCRCGADRSSPRARCSATCACPRGAKTVTCASRSSPPATAGTIDPRPVLANWTQLDAALHPQGAKGRPSLLGATASDVFLLSKSQLELEVLSDPGHRARSAVLRHEVASGAIDKRVLAVLAFLSRSGLKPTVQRAASWTRRRPPLPATLAARDTNRRRGRRSLRSTASRSPATRARVRSPTRTIRTLLTLQGEFVPSQIVSLMQLPRRAEHARRAPTHGDYGPDRLPARRRAPPR